MELPELKPHPADAKWTMENGVLSLEAGPRTDLFNDPFGRNSAANTPMLVFKVADDFTLSAAVEVDFRSTYDAGVLVIYQHPRSWAKLCFELSPQGVPSVVSVVTKGSSDDCNSYAIPGSRVHYRVAKMGKVFAFHYLERPRHWSMVRLFELEDAPTQAGFLAQSPTGEGCAPSFSQIEYRARTLGDVRSGE
ncbi:MAG: DUF1349 domain-containing protein [Meiothermus sp.]|nr:DUF1349 domain-containing protein [Meiothermus sp.]